MLSFSQRGWWLKALSVADSSNIQRESQLRRFLETCSNKRDKMPYLECLRKVSTHRCYFQFEDVRNWASGRGIFFVWQSALPEV